MPRRRATPAATNRGQVETESEVGAARGRGRVDGRAPGGIMEVATTNRGRLGWGGGRLPRAARWLLQAVENEGTPRPPHAVGSTTAPLTFPHPHPPLPKAEPPASSRRRRRRGR